MTERNATRKRLRKLIAILTILLAWLTAWQTSASEKKRDNAPTLTLHNALELHSLCESGKADSLVYPKFLLSEGTLHNLVKMGLAMQGVQADCDDRVDIAVAEGDLRVELAQEAAADALAEVTSLYEHKLSWSFEWWHLLVAALAGAAAGAGVTLGVLFQ